MPALLLDNVRIFDGENLAPLPEAVRVEDGRITQVGACDPRGAERVDCGGRVLLPGLIDAHVHVYAAGLNVGKLARMPLSYLALFAARFLRASLDRGFTTLRDCGGADVGLATALHEGLVTPAPRLFWGGRVISQTGGHGDFRPGEYELDEARLCGCAAHSDALAVVADGADAVRRAVREELRRGAQHIKIMGSGGVVSPTDPLERCQYSDAEIRAAVEETERAGTYVASHCHPAEAIRRAADLGVRSIEHATLIDKVTADAVAKRGAFCVPTMATFFALLDQGAALGLPPASVAKLQRIGGRALEGIEIMRAAGVKMALGTDLLGSLHTRQGTELTLRRQVLPALDILRSATSVGAELLGQAGELGCIRPGAVADLLLVNGNPLEEIELLERGGDSLAGIMQAGRWHKSPSGNQQRASGQHQAHA